ncbi:MAG: ribulose-phosphate 3-epimerase [Candidatus Thermoplasmatota archaeon]
MRKLKIAPSIISADFANLGEQLKILKRTGIDMIHIDVMDGNFVPNITIGAPVIKSLRVETKLIFDTHLMIQNPERFIADFANAGSDIITVHLESKGNISKALKLIKGNNIKCGLAVNPATKLSKALPFINKIDLLLIMTVNPGFAGQRFISSVLPKLERARKIIDKKNLNIELEVDGGINSETAPLAVKAGADILVAGSFVFKGDMVENIRKLKELVSVA